VIDQTVTAIGLIGSIVSTGGVILLGREASPPWWIGLALFMLLFSGGIIYAVLNDNYRLREAARPKLVFRDVSSVSRQWRRTDTTHRFEIEIYNDSTAMLDDCHVRLEALTSNDGRFISNDHLPKSLLTRKDDEATGDRQARFRLRPKQGKLVGICSRPDGPLEDITFCFEGTVEKCLVSELADCKDMTATLVAFGPPTPTSVAVRIFIDASNRLHVEKTEPIGQRVGHA